MEMHYKISSFRPTKCVTLLIFALLLLSNVAAVAQQAVVKGNVASDVDGLPIIGATVTVEGEQVGTTTDIDGNFILPNAPQKGTLIFSYIGYRDIKAVITNGKTYQIRLVEDSEAIEEVLVVGYGTMRKAEVTGAVTRVDSEEIAKINTADFATALQGQVAGVNVQSSSGEPGEAANIQIRGISSISGSNTPLYVIDGVPFDSDPGLSAEEIDSIDILKDAASAAIYGTRGAAGVILITTKKGKVGKTRVSFNASQSVQRISSDIDLSDTNQWLYSSILANRMTQAADAYTTDDMAWTTLRNSTKNFFNNSSLYDVIVRDYQPIQNYSLNVNGGNELARFSLSGSYFDQSGIIINSEYTRLNVRASLDLDLGKWKVSSVISLKDEDRLSPVWGLFMQSYVSKPFTTQVDPDADIVTSASDESSDLTSMATSLARIKETTTKESNNYTGNFNFAYSVNDNLTLSTRVALSHTSTITTNLSPLFELYYSSGALYSSSTTRSSLKLTNATSKKATSESMVDWTKKYGKHDLHFTGVFSLEQNDYQSFYAEIYDLTTNDIVSLNVGTSDMTVGTGSGQYGQDRTTTLVGMLGRFQYNYADKYMMSASLRRDGSSRMSAENRWGMFPSVSAGWNITEENFWSADRVDAFKIRASYGTTGNQNFTDYAYETVMTQDLDYAFGGQGNDSEALGSAMTAYANENIKWETTEQANIGIDFAAFKNKLTISADIYQSNKRDMLFPLLLPGSAGTGASSTLTTNIGNMENKGFELAVGYRGKIKKVNYNANLTLSKNVNTVTSMGGVSDMYYFSDGSPVTSGNNDLVTVIAVGYEAGAFMVMPTDGLVNTEQKLYEYQKLDGSARMGDLMYVDTNEDGVIDDNDRVYGGSGTPEFEIGFNAGLNYAGFDFSMNWYASLGNEVINGSQIYSYQNMTAADMVYMWSDAYPESSIPAYTGTSTHNNYRSYADIWVQDGSFLRLKNVTLGYSLPKKTLQKLSLTKFRIYASADNILTITSYDGYDPEIGSNGLSKKGLDQGTYPVASQMRVGVQLGF